MGRPIKSPVVANDRANASARVARVRASATLAVTDAHVAEHLMRIVAHGRGERSQTDIEESIAELGFGAGAVVDRILGALRSELFNMVRPKRATCISGFASVSDR